MGKVKLSDSKSGPPLHFRGGSIIPHSQLPSKYINTNLVRTLPILLGVYPNKQKTAFGDLFWDDGESVETIESGKYNYYEFHLLNNCSLEVRIVKSGYTSTQKINIIAIANTNSNKITARVDGVNVTNVNIHEDYVMLNVDINLSLKKANEKWIIDWKTENNECNIKS